MTLLTDSSDISYAGLIGQDTFAYNFRVDNKADMNITLDGVAVAQGDFTITGLGNASGGDAILNAALLADVTVVLFREVPLTQEVDYQPFDAFPAETHEGALDKLTMITQQNGSSITRSLRYPVGDTTNPVLPDVPNRQDKFLGFDSNGQAVALAGTGGGDPNAVQKPAAAVTAGNFMEFDANKNAVDSGVAKDSLNFFSQEILFAAVPASGSGVELEIAHGLGTDDYDMGMSLTADDDLFLGAISGAIRTADDYLYYNNTSTTAGEPVRPLLPPAGSFRVNVGNKGPNPMDITMRLWLRAR